MKWNWEPVALAELVRQAVLAAVLFKLVNWDDTQVAGFLMLVSALLAFITRSLTLPTAVVEDAGASKTQVIAAAQTNLELKTPGGTGSPNTPGGAGGPSAPSGLGNFSPKDQRGLQRTVTNLATGHAFGLRAVMVAALSVSLAGAALTSACGGSNPELTPAGAARETGDVLELANAAHKAVFDGYVAGTVPTQFSDPFMDSVERLLLPAARKTMTALRAWQTATTVDLKAVRAGELQAALATFDQVSQDVFGVALPPGVATTIQDIASRTRRVVAQIKALIAAARGEVVFEDVDWIAKVEPFTIGGRVTLPAVQ